jgi:cell wall-associated NlpC family hydrolase
MQPGDLVFYAYNTADPATIHHVGIYIGAAT